MQIKVKLLGVINKPIIHPNSFKIPIKLHSASAALQSMNTTLTLVTTTLMSSNTTLSSVTTTLMSSNTTLHESNTMLMLSNTTLMSSNSTLHSSNSTLNSTITTLHSGDATLHLSNTTLHSLFVGLFYILSKLKLINTHQIINIKCFICNFKGLYFNLDFIDFHKIRIQINI